ncbi:MAG TPA: hypothetical protein VFP48_03995, partial [Steroidobacteraceae bacterium]|nr:hypothetical protein [Steroidobacteraceae bacterium]
MRSGVTAIGLALAIGASAVVAEDTPVYPDGNKIEGVWNAQLTYRNCATGVVMFTGQSLVAYAHGGVVTTITSGAAPSGRYPGLGVWRHVAGHEYQSTFKEFWYTPDGTFGGKIIAVVSITHEPDDTLTTRAVGRFHNAAGEVVMTICPTGVAT